MESILPTNLETECRLPEGTLLAAEPMRPFTEHNVTGSKLPANAENQNNLPEGAPMAAKPKRPFTEPKISLPFDVLETTKFFYLADCSGLNLNGGCGEL